MTTCNNAKCLFLPVMCSDTGFRASCLDYFFRRRFCQNVFASFPHTGKKSIQRKHRIALFLRVFICATLCNAPHLLYLISFAIFELPAFDKTNKCPGSSHYSLELLKLPENCELLRWGTECAVLQWLLPLAFIPPLLTQKKRWHLVLGTQKSNGNMGSLKAPPVLHAFLMLTQFSSYPSC